MVDDAILGSPCLGKQYLSETLQIFYWEIRKGKLLGACFQCIIQLRFEVRQVSLISACNLTFARHLFL